MAVDAGVFSWLLAVVCSPWRLMLVCSHGGWRWYVLMAVDAGVFSWRLMLVCAYGG